jgi:hypothetical protein
VALQIRRGDKVTGPLRESTIFSINHILDKSIRTLSKLPSTLFVQTDDINCVEEIKEILPGIEIISRAGEDTQGFFMRDLVEASPEERWKHTCSLLIENEILLRATRAFVDDRSNLGRFHKLAAWDKVSLYANPSDAEVLEDNDLIGPWNFQKVVVHS